MRTTLIIPDALMDEARETLGFTSKTDTVVHALRDPGVLAHGVELKPGKTICLAVTNGKPVVVLPGFPTSAIFTFHEFVAPVVRAFAGLPPERSHSLAATFPMRVNSERGRT